MWRDDRYKGIKLSFHGRWNLKGTHNCGSQQQQSHSERTIVSRLVRSRPCATSNLGYPTVFTPLCAACIPSLIRHVPSHTILQSQSLVETATMRKVRCVLSLMYIIKTSADVIRVVSVLPDITWRNFLSRDQPCQLEQGSEGERESEREREKERDNDKVIKILSRTRFWTLDWQKFNLYFIYIRGPTDFNHVEVQIQVNKISKF